MLHFILLFNPLLFSRLLPFPILGVLLKSLGARFGENSYCSGIIMDPPFVRLGDNSLIGNDAMLIAHVIEGEDLGFQPISIGDNVTIGARAIIMAGVTIEDGAIVGVQSVVRKGTLIKRNETWVGCPARRIET
jgi:acetyltransferase-like isoleucine patch superfamily enzyme